MNESRTAWHARAGDVVRHRRLRGEKRIHDRRPQKYQHLRAPALEPEDMGCHASESGTPARDGTEPGVKPPSRRGRGQKGARVGTRAPARKVDRYLIRIFVAGAAISLGRCRTSMPSRYSAATFSPTTGTGRRIVRTNFPIARSLTR